MIRPSPFANPRALAITADLIEELKTRKAFLKWWEDIGAPERQKISRQFVDIITSRLYDTKDRKDAC